MSLSKRQRMYPFLHDGKKVVTLNCVQGPAALMKEMQYKSSIDQSLIISGEKDRFKELLRTRLIECGWRDQIQMLCRQVVKERGIESLKAEDLINEITPKGRALVPDAVKKELLQKIKTHFSQDL